MENNSILILTIEQKILRSKIEMIFRTMYDLGGIIPKTFVAGEIQILILSQVLSTLVKVLHQTRTPGKVENVPKPTPHMIEVGKALQDTMNHLFNDLEAAEVIATSIPMASRHAPVYETYVNKVALQIEAIYGKPEIYKDSGNGMQIIK